MWFCCEWRSMDKPLVFSHDSNALSTCSFIEWNVRPCAVVRDTTLPSEMFLNAKRLDQLRWKYNGFGMLCCAIWSMYAFLFSRSLSPSSSVSDFRDKKMVGRGPMSEVVGTQCLLEPERGCFFLRERGWSNSSHKSVWWPTLQDFITMWAFQQLVMALKRLTHSKPALHHGNISHKITIDSLSLDIQLNSSQSAYLSPSIPIMTRQCITEPQNTSHIQATSHTEDESFFNFFASKIGETRQSFISMTTTSKADAHSSLILDFNASNKVWNFSLWS